MSKYIIAVMSVFVGAALGYVFDNPSTHSVTFIVYSLSGIGFVFIGEMVGRL